MKSLSSERTNRSASTSPARPISSTAVAITLTSALAAAAPAHAASHSKSETFTELAPITVSAQRIQQNAQQVPIAISAFTGAQLKQLQIANLNGVKYLVPNLYLESNLSNAGTPKIFMRGIGQANDAFSFSSPVGIYVDGVYYPQDVGSMIDFLDIKRIEVLRGPQGTIYGRNSSIGAIRIITKNPPLHSPEATGDLTFGSEHQHNARLLVGLPLIPGKVGFSLAFNSKYNDGFQVNTTNGERTDSEDSNAGRAQLLVKVNRRLNVIIRGDFLQDDSRPAVAMSFLHNTLSSLRYESERSYSQGTARSRLRTFGGSVTVHWRLGDEKLTSISALRGVQTVDAFDSDGTILPSFEVNRSNLNDRSVTQELFVTGPRLASLPISWVGGMFYLHEKTRYLWSLQIFAPPSVQDFHQVVNSLAGYFQGTYHLTDKLSATGGVRYTTEHKSFDVVSHLADGSFDFAFHDPHLGTDRWTWRGALDYQLRPSVMLYASAATGFRSGGLNGNATSRADVTGGAFQREDTLVYESGVKSEFLHHRIRVNADYFYGEYDHLQEAVVLQNGQVSNINNTAYVNGLELQAAVVPFTGLELSGNLGTLNDTIAHSSTKLPDAPHLSWNLAATYSHGAGDLGVMSGTVSFSHAGSSFTDAANSPILQVAAHNNINANVSLSTPDDHWMFTLAGLNLTNRIYATGGFYIAGGLLAAVKWPSLPRRWEFTVRYKY